MPLLKSKLKKLNLGCGPDYKIGWINLDCRDNVKTDLKWDLKKFPYPFGDNAFEEILMDSVLEHLQEPIKVLKELIRICKNGAKIILLVPHAYSYANISDLQHKNNFTENSFAKKNLEEYELENLELIKTKFVFKDNKWKRYLPFKKYLKIFLNGVYDDLYFEFKVKKI